MYLVRDARWKVGVESIESVCKLCVGFIDTDVKDSVNSLEESCGEVFCGVARVVGRSGRRR